MITIRPRTERGHTRIDWLDSYHTFSFGDYHDPRHMGFSDLRVINDDIIQPGMGFDTHGHRDMEILTYVLSGTLAHKDNMGNGSLIHAGEVQRMTAGTGVLHSEFNPSETEPVHLLQIWILPETKGLTPGYEQTAFSTEERRNQWRRIAGRRPANQESIGKAVTLHQDVTVDAALLGAEQALSCQMAPSRSGWLHVATGALTLNDQLLEAGDGVAIGPGEVLTLTGMSRETEVLLLDLRADTKSA